MNFKEFNVIKGFESWLSITPLNKGWSKDKKYLILDKNNQKYLLRISSISLLEKKKKQFEYMKKINELNINASRCLDFGLLNDQEIYMLLTYLDGEAAEDIISSLSEREAYELGISAGKILQKIQNIRIENVDKSWSDKYQEKMIRKIEAFNNLKLEVPNKKIIIEYLQNHIHLVKDRPQSFCHGDYHIGNMIINNREIGIIDFDKCGIDDPYDDFKPFCWNVFHSEYFETGLINGYFNNQVPIEFWQILALYAAESLISHLPWAITFGEEEIRTAYKVMTSVLKWYNNFNLIIPTWFKKVT